MTKRHQRQRDGYYHVNGEKYKVLEGSRAQVWHGTAYKTSGGLTKKDLHKNKHDRIVSKKKHTTAKKERRLEKHGWGAKKGQFGPVRLSETRKHRSTRKK